MSTRQGSPALSRRSLFAIAASGVALVSAAAIWRRREPDAEAARPVEPVPAQVVDHDGWIVTPDEKRALAQRRRSR